MGFRLERFGAVLGPATGVSVPVPGSSFGAGVPGATGVSFDGFSSLGLGDAGASAASTIDVAGEGGFVSMA